MRTIFFSFLLLLTFSQFAQTQEHGRGYVRPSQEVQAARSVAMKARHDSRMALLPVQTDAAFDIVAKGWTIPVGDQGSCGSCWLYSAVLNISSAYVKAGYGKDWRFSYQHMMDCGPNDDPCNGGDEYDIFEVAKSDGLVTEADYGVAYQASKGRCRYTNQKKWKIGDFLYCDPVQQSGRTSTQAIKNAMVSYGMVSIALDATRFDSYTGGVMTTGQSIDHAVNIVGWDDGKTVMQDKKSPMDLPKVTATGAFKIQNQWSTDWGLQGFGWVSYSSYLVEGMVCSVSALPPTPPTPPVPPTPVPPGTLYKMTQNADGSITFSPSASGGVLTPDQFKALQDEIRKLQEMINQQKSTAAPPCKEVQAMKDRVDKLEKRMDAEKSATNKNLGDIVDIVDMQRKAIDELKKKIGTASRKTDEESILVVLLPSNKADAPIWIEGSIGKQRTAATGPVRRFSSEGGGEYTVTATLDGKDYARVVEVPQGRTVTVDFTMAP